MTLRMPTPTQLIHAAQRFGTPLYAYDAGQIAAQYQRLEKAFSGQDVRFFYAAKALTNIHILDLIRRLGARVDCSSINEVALAFHAGFSAGQILYTSSNISFEEIKAAVAYGVTINIDSLSNLEKFAREFGGSYPVGVRLRPNIMAGGNLKISTGHAASKFGIPVEEVGKVHDLIRETGLLVRTLHIHTGSEIADVDIFAKGLRLLLDLSDAFPGLEVIDLGGGFKVPYRAGEKGTDIESLAEKVGEAFARHEAETGRHLQAWFEPGKFLVAEAGRLLARVTVLKQSGEICFAGTDTGLNHLIRPMFYDAWHEIDNVSNPDGQPKIYHVVGNICETDTFAENRAIPEIREGDLLAFRNAGAYGFEMASHYNSRFRPAEVLWENGDWRLIRRRDSLEDLLRNQAPLPR